MKSIILSVAIAATTFASCNNNTKKTGESSSKDSTTMMPESGVVYACSMHPEVTGNKGEKCPKCGMELTEVKKETSQTTTPVTNGVKGNVSIKEIITSYLQVKKELVSDNSSGAASAAATLQTSMSSLNVSSMNASQQKVYEDVKDDAIEHAEHISSNGGKIEHQREHFDMLSKDMYDMVKAFNSGQTLYRDFCPMYNNNKGAYWISEKKDIENPYYGKAMLKCGTIKEEIK